MLIGRAVVFRQMDVPQLRAEAVQVLAPAVVASLQLGVPLSRWKRSRGTRSRMAAMFSSWSLPACGTCSSTMVTPTSAASWHSQDRTSTCQPITCSFEKNPGDLP
jgi:hypothetical protein